MAAVISFAAWSKTGKTTYLEKLIPELKSLGLCVAVIKHYAHEFEMDVKGKDSWRFMAAGADAVSVVSAGQIALIDRRKKNLEDVIAAFSDVDIILMEGYKNSRYPQIALFRAEALKPLAISPESCLAIVTDVPMDAPCPIFPLDDPAPLARYLFGWLAGRSSW